jgi:hypothetical protein
MPQGRTPFEQIALLLQGGDALVPQTDSSPQQIASLFDYPVSADEHQFRHGELSAFAVRKLMIS